MSSARGRFSLTAPAGIGKIKVDIGVVNFEPISPVPP
jgi:hypothetical protein